MNTPTVSPMRSSGTATTADVATAGSSSMQLWTSHLHVSRCFSRRE